MSYKDFITKKKEDSLKRYTRYDNQRNPRQYRLLFWSNLPLKNDAEKQSSCIIN